MVLSMVHEVARTLWHDSRRTCEIVQEPRATTVGWRPQEPSRGTQESGAGVVLSARETRCFRC